MTDVSTLQLEALKAFVEHGNPWAAKRGGFNVTTGTMKALENKGLLVRMYLEEESRLALTFDGVKTLQYHGVLNSPRLHEVIHEPTKRVFYIWKPPPPPPPPTPRQIWEREKNRLTVSIEAMKEGRADYLARYDQIMAENEYALADLLDHEPPKEES
jgi:hypothetical protein